MRCLSAALTLGIWLASPALAASVAVPDGLLIPEAAARTPRCEGNVCEIRYDSAQSPEQVLAQFEERLNGAQTKFTRFSDGIGFVLRVTTPETNSLVKIREGDSGGAAVQVATAKVEPPAVVAAPAPAPAPVTAPAAAPIAPAGPPVWPRWLVPPRGASKIERPVPWRGYVDLYPITKQQDLLVQSFGYGQSKDQFRAHYVPLLQKAGLTVFKDNVDSCKTLHGHPVRDCSGYISASANGSEIRPGSVVVLISYYLLWAEGEYSVRVNYFVAQ